MLNFFQRLFDQEDESDIINRKYPEVLLYEEYKSKYNDKVKLIEKENGYFIKDNAQTRPVHGVGFSYKIDGLSELNSAKYHYVNVCKYKFENTFIEREV